MGDEYRTKRVVPCAECGSWDLPECMWSGIDEEGKPCWLCEDCHPMPYKDKQPPKGGE